MTARGMVKMQSHECQLSATKSISIVCAGHIACRLGSSFAVECAVELLRPNRCRLNIRCGQSSVFVEPFDLCVEIFDVCVCVDR